MEFFKNTQNRKRQFSQGYSHSSLTGGHEYSTVRGLVKTLRGDNHRPGYMRLDSAGEVASDEDMSHKVTNMPNYYQYQNKDMDHNVVIPCAMDFAPVNQMNSGTRYSCAGFMSNFMNRAAYPNNSSFSTCRSASQANFSMGLGAECGFPFWGASNPTIGNFDNQKRDWGRDKMAKPSTKLNPCAPPWYPPNFKANKSPLSEKVFQSPVMGVTKEVTTRSPAVNNREVCDQAKNTEAMPNKLNSQQIGNSKQGLQQAVLSDSESRKADVIDSKSSDDNDCNSLGKIIENLKISSSNNIPPSNRLQCDSVEFASGSQSNEVSLKESTKEVYQQCEDGSQENLATRNSEDLLEAKCSNILETNQDLQLPPSTFVETVTPVIPTSQDIVSATSPSPDTAELCAKPSQTPRMCIKISPTLDTTEAIDAKHFTAQVLLTHKADTRRKKCRPSSKRRHRKKQKREDEDSSLPQVHQSCKKSRTMDQGASAGRMSGSPPLKTLFVVHQKGPSSPLQASPASTSGSPSFSNTNFALGFLIQASEMDSEDSEDSGWDDDSESDHGDIADISWDALPSGGLTDHSFDLQISCHISNSVQSDTEEEEADVIQGAGGMSPEMLREANKRWLLAYAGNDNTKCTPSKIKFESDDHLTQVFPVAPDPALCPDYEAARKGPWEEYARDRARFLNRIHDVEKILAPCLTEEHRKKVINRMKAVEC